MIRPEGNLGRLHPELKADDMNIMDEVLYNEVSVFGLFTVRDTVINTWITMVFILIFVIVARRRLVGLLEMLIDFVTGVAEESMPGKDVSPYVPFLGALTLFIAVANIISVVPLVGSPTKDINTPLALALVVFFVVHIFGVVTLGFGKYLKKYASPLAILDVIGQASRTLSLTLRLFGNILSGEIIVAVIYLLVKPVAPLVMVALGMVTGILQAYIFTVLTSGYIASAIEVDA